MDAYLVEWNRLLVVIRILFMYFLPACIWLYFFVEASMTKNPSVLPRYAWALLTLLLPGVGTLLWIAFGRKRRARGLAPDDDPKFLRAIDDEVWRKRLREWRNRKDR